jgi:hypothetical protein
MEAVMHYRETGNTLSLPGQKSQEPCLKRELLYPRKMVKNRKKGKRMEKQRYDLLVEKKSDQEVSERYVKEMLKLKTLNQFGRQSDRFLGYPNTLVRNLCRRELARRDLPIPRVSISRESV